MEQVEPVNEDDFTVFVGSRKDTKEYVYAVKIQSEKKDRIKIKARGFAEKMWNPNAEIFLSHKGSNNGVQKGKAAWLCAGSYIGRLKKRNLVRDIFYGKGQYRITEEGIKARGFPIRLPFT